MDENFSLEINNFSPRKDELMSRDQLVEIAENFFGDIDEKIGLIGGEIDESRSNSIDGWFLTNKMQMGGFFLFDNYKGVLILVNNFEKEDQNYLKDGLSKFGELYICSLNPNSGLPTKLPKEGDFSFERVRKAVLGNRSLGGIVGNLNPFEKEF